MRTFLQPPVGFDAPALARATAPGIGLTLAPDDLAKVAANLERTAGFALLLAQVPGIDLVEPAPVFRAGQGGGT